MSDERGDEYMDDELYVTIPCFLAISVTVDPADAIDCSDDEVIEQALEAAYDWWERIKFPSHDVHFTDESGRQMFATFDDSGSDAGPLRYLHQGGGVGYVHPLEATVDR